MKNLHKYIAYSLLTATAVGMSLIAYSTDRMQKKVTKFGYISTKLGDVNERMKSVKNNADRLLVGFRRFNEELKLKQMIREELERNDLRRRLE